MTDVEICTLRKRASTWFACNVGAAPQGRNGAEDDGMYCTLNLDFLVEMYVLEGFGN